MTNVAVANNTAEENAGGVLNFRGQVFIDSSEFDGNEALGLNTENFPFVVGRGGGMKMSARTSARSSKSATAFFIATLRPTKAEPLLITVSDRDL